MAVLFQDFDGALDERAPVPSDFTRLRIINQSGIPVTVYGILPFPR
jgi:hypothetical protein